MPPQNIDPQKKEVLETGVTKPTVTSPFPETLPANETVLDKIRSPLHTLRTYQGDVEEVLHTKKESLVSIVSAESKAKEQKDIFKEQELKKYNLGVKVETSFATLNKKYEPLPKDGILDQKTAGIKKKENIFLTYGILPLVGITLFILGGGAIFGVYYYTHRLPTPVVVTTNATLVPYSIKKDIPITNGNERNDIITNTTTQIQSFNQSLGTELYLHFVKGQSEVSPTDFLYALAPNAPSLLVRSIDGQYMAGVYASTKNSPFLIFSSADYGQTFSGMLSWETTMQNDLSGFFPSLGTTSLTSAPLPFSDDTFNNKNVRVLRNTAGKIILVYGFFDTSTVAITTDETIFQSLDDNYTNAKLVH